MTRRFFIGRPITLELKLIIWVTLAAILSLRVAEAAGDQMPMPIGPDSPIAGEQ